MQSLDISSLQIGIIFLFLKYNMRQTGFKIMSVQYESYDVNLETIHVSRKFRISRSNTIFLLYVGTSQEHRQKFSMLTLYPMDFKVAYLRL